MSRPHKEHDVFISFRGEDTRDNFTSHLHAALVRKGIKAYIDNYLRKGEDVWPALCQAIENSDMAIIVLSKNYATSSWCLHELVKILECRKKGQVVIPVFHDVDPSDIRKHQGTYGEVAFAKHRRELLRVDDEESVEKKVTEWKDALYKASNISGRDTSGDEYMNESQVIDKIIQDVLLNQELMYPHELEVKYLTGFDKICKNLQKRLSSKRYYESKNVKAIGIWGMGGIGKTTLAKVLFSQLFAQFDAVCFLENVRKASHNAGQSKLTSLREKLYSELLKEEHLKSTESRSIGRRLNSKRVLVVLDDVDIEDQLDLDALCNECVNQSGPDSKLIITTRDRQVLITGPVAEDDIYEVKTWSFKESLELFCLSAFNQRRPEKGYEDLSKRAVDYAGGIPLALKVLGSNLRKRDTEFWESELDKLKDYPDDRIQSVLRVSYDGLSKPGKEIFLDIAFFFKEENKVLVERILNACGFYATSGLDVLEDKALITISSSKIIQMHDLVQDMGLAIVRQDIKNPGERSRLRDVEEVSDVLEYKKKGSDAVEGIKLDLSQIGSLSLKDKAFSKMTDIRYLKLYIPPGKESGKLDYPKVLKKFSGKLRYLEWHGYRLTSLPETFCTQWLVEIHMPQSHITHLWKGDESNDVKKLERIDLRECKHFQNLPDLSNASKLKWVNLSGCESLDELHPSILSRDTLETLTLDGCKRLKTLTCEKHLKSLTGISVNGCESLREFSISSDKMEELDLNNAGIETLHLSIEHSRNLKQLKLMGLGIKNLPNDLPQLNGLKKLIISNCKFLVLNNQNLHALFDGLRSLQLLHLKDCSNLFELPDNINVLTKLRELILDRSNVKTLPESIKHLSHLEVLSLSNCAKLERLPELPTYIKEFYAVNCTSLVKVTTLKSFATVMEGKEKYISFENCMNLDAASHHRITEGAELSAMNAIFQNVLVRSHMFTASGHSRHNYNFVKFCSPGSSVPKQFEREAAKSSLTVKLPSRGKVLGLVLWAVLSPSDEIKKHGAKIFCQFYSKSNGTKVGEATKWYDKAIRELNGDHVFMWYDALHFDSVVKSYEQHVNVEFYVTDAYEKRDVLLNVCTKECGVQLIFEAELSNLLRDLDLDSDSKKRMRSEICSELGLKL